MDFSQAVITDLSNYANLSYSYDGNGMLTVVAQYNSSLQGQSMNFTFNPALVSNQFSRSSNYNLNLTVDPKNNVPAIFYQESAYSAVDAMNAIAKVLTYLALVMFIVSLFTAKFIGVEMVGVLQVAFIGLMMVVELPPLLSTISSMVPVNGYNSVFNTSGSQNQNVPIRVTCL